MGVMSFAEISIGVTASGCKAIGGKSNALLMKIGPPVAVRVAVTVNGGSVTSEARSAGAIPDS